MHIRKTYKFEAAHIVRDCSSRRCSHSIHGHSYRVEFILACDTLDNGGMVIDFGLLKGLLGQLADSFDHAFMVWTGDDEAVTVAKMTSERIVFSPLNLSAENMAIMFHAAAQNILETVNFKNGEGEVTVHSVIVHETDTGYAQAFEADTIGVFAKLQRLQFSPAIMKDWDGKEFGARVTHGTGGAGQFEMPLEV